MVPKPHQRPWRPPQGFFCMYEDYFTDAGLRFLLPDFLVRYCLRWKIAFSLTRSCCSSQCSWLDDAGRRLWNSPSSSEMGKASRQFPIYVDTFGEDSSVETDVNVSAVVTEQQQVVTKVSESGVIETNRRAASEDRMTRLSDAQARKKASGSVNSRSYCGEFPRKVIGSSREIPPVESPIAKNLYQIWACKEVQSITTGNALYNFLEEQAREAREETVVVQKNERSRNLLQQLVCVT
ncbi:hypothetical protein AtEden1_Chr5g0112141 [Arabidopsis thaliana]